MNQTTLPTIPQSPNHPTPALPEATNPQSHYTSNHEQRTPEAILTAEEGSHRLAHQLTKYEFEICKDILNRVLDGMHYLEFTQYYALDPNFTIIMDKDETAGLRRALKKF